MPPCYDIYGLSPKRERETIEKFLSHFSFRDKIENREGQEIFVQENEKYNAPEISLAIHTLTEVIDYGLLMHNHGFSFYISDHLKENINGIIIKFTYDGKIILGVSVEADKGIYKDKLMDNYRQALEVEKTIASLLETKKTTILFENPPEDDEDEFEQSMVFSQQMKKDKRL